MQQQDARRAALDRLFLEAPARADWFAPTFLALASAGTVADIVAGLESQHGPHRETAAAGEDFVVHLARADIPTRLALDAQGRIAMLLFQSPVSTGGGMDDYVQAIAVLPGRTAVLVATDGCVRASHAPDVPLAVGSAFKLAVLRAVAAACEAGQLAWDRVVLLDPVCRSLPSGILQDWPDATPLTVATLANLMISISDNTATDALIHLVGRDAVEAVSGRNTPFPTTREVCVLKAGANGALRQAWLAADAAGRRALLASMAALPLPRTGEIAPEPTVEVEWFLTAEELCALLEATHHLPPFRINPGPAKDGRWRSVAYKGGSETGVLNLSALAVAASGRRHCVIATWNDAEALDQERLVAPFRALVRLLADEG